MGKRWFQHLAEFDGTPRRVFLKRLVRGTGLLVLLDPSVFRSASDSEPSPGGTTAADSAMSHAGDVFLRSLSQQQREQAVLRFDGDQREDWHYIPKPRKGIPYKQLSEAQTKLAHDLLSTGLSQRGLQKASNIISLEPVLHETEPGNGPERDSGLYYFTMFGEPGSPKPWGWSFEGHHVSLNYTLMDGSTVVSTPSFMGANPAEVQHGPRKGLRTLPSEEDLARTLLKSLDDQQRAQAVVSPSAPADILSGHSRKADPINPSGVQASRLSGKQSEILMSLLDEYAGNMAPAIAAARMRKLRSAGFSNICFAWAGEFEHGRPHYYRIQGPTFLIEYDNIQDQANHIHSVWRDFSGDFGADLLAEHYKTSHRREGSTSHG